MNIYFDIETATIQKPSEFEWKLLDIWTDRVAKWDDPIETYKTKWPIYAEYGQVICVSIWVEKKDWELKMISFYQTEKIDEKKLLENLKTVLDHDNMKSWMLVWHNILWFDIPYLAKRYIVNGIELPHILRIWGKKPREVNVFDTLKMWKFTGVMWASLCLLCEILDVDTPKDDIDWSETNDCFWNWEYERIRNYCEKDVVATHEVYKKLLDCKIDYGQN